MELQVGEMALPLNSTYGGGHGHGHGHMIHHESEPHNHIVSSSPAAAEIPITNGPTVIVPPPPSSSSMEETVVVPYNNNNNRMMTVVRYKECLKNHAASIGGSATDGCGEFMPSGEDGTLEAFTCSACNCHRNFHRKEIETEAHHHHHHQQQHQLPYDYSYHHSSAPHLRTLGVGNGRKVILQGHYHRGGSVLGSESFGYNHNNPGVLVPSRPMIMSYNMGIGSLPSESDEQPQPHHMVKKRFRTKFTQEQKEKMLSFAEKVGWKIQKQEESVVQQFCQELGIKRRVLKVWMHNNKHNLAKKINPVPTTNPQSQI